MALSIGQCASLACLLEATAPKPGNVHRAADFEDVSFTDFGISAIAIGPAMEAAREMGVGATVLEAVQATRELVRSNTNLGMILLLAPLSAVPWAEPLRTGVARVLRRLTGDDSQLVYEAIRLAAPGGLGKVESMDVAESAPTHLREAMQAAAERDSIARQYVDEFSTVFDQVLPWLLDGRSAGLTLTQAIIHVHVRLMSELPDSLIARKCGNELAVQASHRAQRVLESGIPFESNYNQALDDFDFWLRSDGHRRNPGTTADLIAAGLFAGLREGTIALSGVEG